MTPKYDYSSRFEISGGNSIFPPTQTTSLTEALALLAAINNGELKAKASVRNKSGQYIVLIAKIRYADIAGASEHHVYQMLDKDIDSQLVQV